MSKLFIYGINIHQGGGRTILNSILEDLSDGQPAHIYLDARMESEDHKLTSLEITYVAPTVFARLYAELMLFRSVSKGDTVLCLGNLPPLLRSKGFVYVFVQNRILLERLSLVNYSHFTRLRIAVERLWLSLFYRNVDAFLVQTTSMRELLKKRLRLRAPVYIFQFIKKPDNFSRGNACEINHCADVRNRFIYVASGEPHKNHSCLIAAWCILAGEGIYPHLVLTLDRSMYPDLCKWIEFTALEHNLKIENAGVLSAEEVKIAYRSCGALIYPSKVESFGLPLIEARSAGISILASELDYVRDLVDPEHSFDPQSPISIARAVKRFLGHPNADLEFLSIKDLISLRENGSIRDTEFLNTNSFGRA